MYALALLPFLALLVGSSLIIQVPLGAFLHGEQGQASELRGITYILDYAGLFAPGYTPKETIKTAALANRNVPVFRVEEMKATQ